MTQGDDLLAVKLQNSRKKQMLSSGEPNISNVPACTNSERTIPADVIPRDPPPRTPTDDRALPKISPSRMRRHKKPWEIPGWVDNLISEGRAKDLEDDQCRKLAFLDHREQLKQTFHLRKLQRKDLESRSKGISDYVPKQDHERFHLFRASQNEVINTRLRNHRDFELAKLAARSRARQFLELSSDSRRRKAAAAYSCSPRDQLQQLPASSGSEEYGVFSGNVEAVRELDSVFLRRLRECVDARFSGRRKIPCFNVSLNHRALTEDVFATPLYN